MKTIATNIIRVFLFLAICINGSLSYSQSFLDDKIATYYHFVNKATTALLSDNSTMAIKYFDSAFQVNKYPFEVDLHNALFVIFQKNEIDTSKVIHYFKMIRRKGVNLLEHYKFNKNYHYYIEQANKRPLPVEFNIENQTLIEDLIAKDQAIRDEAFKKYNDIYINETNKQIDSVDSLCFNRLQIIINGSFQKKTPLEELIGINNYHNFYTILRHNSVLWGRYDNTKLLEMVKLGLIDNRQYAVFVDESMVTTNKNDYYNEANLFRFKRQYKVGYGTFMNTYIQTETTSVILLPDNSKLVQINHARKQIGLSDWNTEIEFRIKAFYTNDGLKFAYTNVINIPDEYLKNTLNIREGYQKRVIYNGKGKFNFN